MIVYSSTEPTADVVGEYRYALSRAWDPELDPVVFVLCNPSNADAAKDDPTARKMRGFAQRWGAGGFCAVNLSPRRTPKPGVLRRLRTDEVGGDAERQALALRAAADLASFSRFGAVFAWGAAARDNLPRYPLRVAEVYRIFRGAGAEIRCLGVCEDLATQRHPSRRSYATPLVGWPP